MDPTDRKIRFMPPQLREIGFHVENYATQWHPFQHEIKNREIVVAWIQLTLVSGKLLLVYVLYMRKPHFGVLHCTILPSVRGISCTLPLI